MHLRKTSPLCWNILPFAWLLFSALAAFSIKAAGAAPDVPRFSVHEVQFRAAATGASAYTRVTADATLSGPGGATRALPLFWDGGAVWKFRFAPDNLGPWHWKIRSNDSGLDGQAGSFTCVASERRGSIRPMRDFPFHFERQDGSRFWFMGDTAWALFTDTEAEKHDRNAAQRYIEARAAQGFNVLHSMLLSEAGWGNAGGPPFEDLAQERLNPAYWQEIDRRLVYANQRGVICGLALAWGDKGRQEPFAWRKFPSLEARKRYARYVAARYSAFDVYFIVSGEWHAEIRSRSSDEETVRREFIELGEAVHAADPHGRMIAIHPMTSHGSVREFNRTSWMSFGDYQQNYHNLHARALQSRGFQKPVVNSEYGYFLRDQSGDGVPDKENSTSLESMRHATWDIVMAGAYVVTGFGTTYFGGNRDPGPFDLEAAKNKPWETQMGYLKRFFTALDWWKLEPHDELLRCSTARGEDRQHLGRIAPPAVTYWCLAEPDRNYIAYVRGTREVLQLKLPAGAAVAATRQFNPRTGSFRTASRGGRRKAWNMRRPMSRTGWFG